MCINKGHVGGCLCMLGYNVAKWDEEKLERRSGGVKRMGKNIEEWIGGI